MLTKIDLNADIRTIRVEPPIQDLKLVEIGEFPNQRTLILPDPGFTIIDMDLDRADAQFVAWEANDEPLKQVLKAGEDLHLQNAKDIWGSHISKNSPERKLAKVFCHAANYGAYPKRLAHALGITVQTAEWIYNRWFKLHPGIRQWHNRVRADLYTKHLVRNPFGFERYYFERPDQVLNEALAWVPQSSVGVIINTAWYQIDPVEKTPENPGVPGVEVLMQVHDSLTMQCPSKQVVELLPKIEEKSLIPVPYDDPLIVPVGFKTSPISWGDVESPCCDEIFKPPLDRREVKDEKTGKWKFIGCKDHALHNELRKVLQRAKETASRQLA